MKKYLLCNMTDLLRLLPLWRSVIYWRQKIGFTSKRLPFFFFFFFKPKFGNLYRITVFTSSPLARPLCSLQHCAQDPSRAQTLLSTATAELKFPFWGVANMISLLSSTFAAFVLPCVRLWLQISGDCGHNLLLGLLAESKCMWPKKIHVSWLFFT